VAKLSAETHEDWDATDKAETEEERSALWREQTQRRMEQWDRERQDLAARFGGRLAYVTSEYQALGMLSEGDAHHLEWEAQSMFWISRAATTLERLARGL
jgi:hypothetical protein